MSIFNSRKVSREEFSALAKKLTDFENISREMSKSLEKLLSSLTATVIRDNEKGIQNEKQLGNLNNEVSKLRYLVYTAVGGVAVAAFFIAEIEILKHFYNLNNPTPQESITYPNSPTK